MSTYQNNIKYRNRLKKMSRDRYHNDPEYHNATLERSKRRYHENSEYRRLTIERAIKIKIIYHIRDCER